MLEVRTFYLLPTPLLHIVTCPVTMFNYNARQEPAMRKPGPSQKGKRHGADFKRRARGDIHSFVSEGRLRP